MNMKRKNFLASLIPLLALKTIANRNYGGFSASKELIPPYLKKGDTIGICCPSGFLTDEDVQPAIAKLEEWGYKVVAGKTVGLKDFTFAGTDADRENDLQAMLDDETVKAVLLGRGGYGAVEL